MKRSNRFLKSMLLGGACALAVAASAAAQGRAFNVQEGDLKQALDAYVRQSGVQLIYSVDAVRGARSHGAHGALSAEDALAQILAGTPFTAQRDASGALAVVRRAESPQAAAAPTALDEVIVTATKRLERAHEVPASISAVSGENLTAIAAARLEDYVAKIPGFVVGDASMANGSAELSIRGLTTGLGGNPTVGVYVDDSPFGGSTLYSGFNIPDLDPQDLARVEVLRGPQGTLYGAGAMGGLLKYVTAAPDYSHVFGRIAVDGSHVDGGGSGYGIRGSANLPINDSLALRISAYDREDPGFVDDAVSGERNVNDARYSGGRAALAWRVNDAWTVKLSALLQRKSAMGVGVVDYDPATGEPLYGDLEQVRSPTTGLNQQNIDVYNITVEGDLGWAALTSATSYNKQVSNFDLEVTPSIGALVGGAFGIPNVGAAFRTTTGLDKFSQEVRLSSPATKRLAWQLGAFYTREHTATHQALRSFDAATGQSIGLPVLLTGDGFTNFEEIAGFGDLTYHFSSRFDVTGGLRYSRNTQNEQQTSGGLLAAGGTTVGSSDDSSVTYLLTPRFRLNDDVMVYARVASGYRPGGPNFLIAADVPPSYGPDSVVNYEVGFKADLFDRSLSLDVAAYLIDWNNIQLHQDTAAGNEFIGNAGGADSKGIEGSLFWRPLAGLEIDGDISYQVARLTSDLPPGAGVGVAFKGDELPSTPRWSGALSADYAFPLVGEWSGLAGVSYQYVGERPGEFTPAGVPRWILPAYGKVDLRLGVKNDRWSLTAYVKNVGDSRGQIGDLSFDTVIRVPVIQPRTFGLAISSTF